ncbi:MAG: amidohydrolase family protein [Planctomycetota bacterium]|jgi:cytosine/adenosine deaminase-related metal-dependent hydrolase
MSLYLHDACFIDGRTLEVMRGHIKVEQGPRGGLEFVEEVPPDAPADAQVIRCEGRFVTRSFVIGHHHIYSTLARGMPPPPRKPRDFNEMLQLVWWNLDRKLDEQMIRASALACAVEAARCGCTFVIDHHASPGAAENSLHVIAEALEEVGLSHLLCYELSDRDGVSAREAGVAETARHLKEYPGLVGLHASFTVSEELLACAVELAREFGTGIHVHVAEAESDESHCRATHGCSVAQRLSRAGALESPATILAHCLHVDDTERDIIRESNAWVVHNTQSNQNNNVGRFDGRNLGERIFIGTDGMHSDVLSGARAMYLEGQQTGEWSPLTAYRRLRRVHDYLEENEVIGDGENNLVVLDYQPPTPVTSDNWPAHVVYGLAARHVRTVISDGRVIVDEDRVLPVDEMAILDEARRQAIRLWELL